MEGNILVDPFTTSWCLYNSFRSLFSKFRLNAIKLIKTLYLFIYLLHRQLERKFSEQNLDAPPSYEEAVADAHSPVHDERY